MNFRILGYLILMHALYYSCARQEKSEALVSTDSNKPDYIRPVDGKNELLDLELVKKGKVLISYSACNSCHT